MFVKCIIMQCTWRTLAEHTVTESQSSSTCHYCHKEMRTFINFLISIGYEFMCGINT